MTNKISNFLLIILFVLITSCGFKTLDYANIDNFKIEKIESSGYQRANFLIKNDLKQSSRENSSNVITIDINTTKERNVKERKLNRKVVKNEVIISANYSIYFIGKNKTHESSFSSSADYIVNKSFANSLRTERKLEKNLTKNISNFILKDINAIINDF